MYRPPGTTFGAGANGGRALLPSQMGRMMTGQVNPTEARPMTSVMGAGFKSSAPKNSGAFDPLGQGRGPAPPLAEKADNSPEDKAKEMEKQVNQLIEESAAAGVKGDFPLALEKAKEAGKKERALCKHRESNGLVEQINLDLTYAVCFNLANAYHQNGMYEEALHTYSLIVKNKTYPQSGRLRVNMGNIFYEQKKYPNAIKMYRMALDQIPNTGKEIRFKIFRNIGNAFVRLGQYQDAIQSYETIMGGAPDFQTGFNLVVCYFARQNVELMRKGFNKLLSIPIQGLADEEEEEEDLKAAEEAEAIGQAKVDGLRMELQKRQKEANNYIVMAAKLIAPFLSPNDWEAGYNWIIDTLKPTHENLASQIELEKALRYLKEKNFDKAIEVMKSFEKKDQKMVAMAATNLSFMYFLEHEFEQADRYADMAIKQDRYNAKALVNKGNCLFNRNEFARAKELYLEAIGVEADCVQAIYNLGLVNLRMELFMEALQAFEKLHTIVPNNPEVIYQIANIYEHQDNLSQAQKWFNILIARVPSDPGILARLGQIYGKEEEESQAFHYHMESYRHYPANLDVISWLGVWYVKSELYEKAIHFFERASQIQPNEVKWKLMVTSCYRRMNNLNKAVELYEKIHNEYPENLECLRYLVAICKDLGRPFEQYQQKLGKLDRNMATRPGGALTRMDGGGGGQGNSNPMPQQQQQQQYGQPQPRYGGGGARGDQNGAGLSQVQEENPNEAALSQPRYQVPSYQAPAGRGPPQQGRDTRNGDREDDDFADADVDELLA